MPDHDLNLIKGIINKNEDSFRQLVEIYKHYILNICFHFLNNRHDAEDLTQEVFIEIYYSASKFRQESKLSTWIYRIAVNKSLNYLRSRKKYDWIDKLESLYDDNTAVVPAEKSDEGENQFMDNERNDLLYTAIDSLPLNQRTAFTLHKFDDMSHKDIAAIMEVSVSAVESLIHRAKQNLQSKLYKYYKKNDH